MISFRFHIVSLTAVLLALGIGLVLGTTFLDDATVNTLKRELTDLEGDLDAAGDRNARQQDQIDTYEREAAGLDEQLGARLFPGQLAGTPVLLITTKGVDEDRVQSLTRALGQADADVVGTWWLTDRLMLDDDDEVADLGDALQLSTDDADRLRSTLANQLGDVLFAASDAAAQPAGQEPGARAARGRAPSVAETDQGEPAVVARLRAGGFIDYELPDGADGDAVVLPQSGLRVVIVGSPEADVPPEQIVMPVLINLAASGPVPVVATEPSVIDPQDGEDPPPSLVIDIREDDDLADRVSTVDDLERASGMVATVLAVADADTAEPRIGHYGLGDGARLLPAPPDEESQ